MGQNLDIPKAQSVLSIIKTLENSAPLSSEYEFCTVDIFFQKTLVWLKGANEHEFIPIQNIDFLKVGQLYTEEDVGVAINNIEEKAKRGRDL